MKKLIIAATLVVAATFGQAATVTWNALNTKLVDKDGVIQTSLTSGSIMLVVLSDNTGWDAGTWSGTSDSVTELASAGIGSGKSRGKITGADYTFSYDDSNPSASPIQNGDILGVVFKDSDGKYSQLTYNTGSAVTETLVVSGLADNTWSGTLNFGQATGVSGIVAGGTSSIPEPTSAMLLMLGLCGLALKRKNA